MRTAPAAPPVRRGVLSGADHNWLLGCVGMALAEVHFPSGATAPKVEGKVWRVKALKSGLGTKYPILEQEDAP